MQPRSMTILNGLYAGILLISAASADACSIVDKREFRLGVDSGVQGRCANNGWRIACTVSQTEQEISCEGPEGVFNGDQIKYLVIAACGCTKQDELQQQLEEQLEDYP